LNRALIFISGVRMYVLGIF